MAAWLKKRGARGSQKMADKAVAAANAQHTMLATQPVGAQLVARLAEQIQAIDADVAALDEQIEQRFNQHRDAPILLSVPGFGVVLAATFLASTGGDLDAFETSTASPASPAWPQHHVTPAGSAATTTAPDGSTAG
ncbi:hypothetical protein JCM18899A_52510 [Nocardioides sp. AN3]